MARRLDSSLRRRFLLTFSLVVLATVGLSAVAYYMVNRLSAALYDVGAVALPSIQGLDRMREALHELARADAEPAILRGNRAVVTGLIERIDAEWREFEAGRAAYEPLPQKAAEAVLWRQFLADLAPLRESHEALVATLRSIAASGEPALPAAAAAASSELASALHAAEQRLDELIDLNASVASEAMAATITTSADVTWVGNVVIVFTAAALFVHFWLAMFVGRSVTRPIEEAEAALRRIAAGNLDVRIPESGSGEVRRLAESVNRLVQTLRDSEEQRSAIGANLPKSFLYQARYEQGKGLRYVYVSPNVKRLTGVAASDLLADPSLLDRRLPDDSRARLTLAREMTQTTAAAHEYTVAAPGPDGSEHYFRISSAPRTLADSSILSDGIVTDVTERVRTERALEAAARALRTISRCRHAVAFAPSEDELLRQVCDSIVEEGGYMMCGVLYRDADAARSVREVARAGAHFDFPADARPTWADDVLGQGPVGAALRTGQVQVFADVQADPRCAPWHGVAAAAGINSIIALPLGENGETFGTLAIYSAEKGPWDPEEVALLTELAGDLQFGIVALRVRGRHDAAVEELRRSEARFRTTIQQSPIGIVVADLSGRFLEVNPAICRITGYSEAELRKLDVASITHPEDLPETEAVIAASSSGSLPAYELTKRYVRRDGSFVWVRVYVTAATDPGGEPAFFIAHIVDETERHAAEQNVAASRARMQLTLDMAKLVYFEVDLAADVVRFDEGFREIFGWPEDDSAGVVLTPQEYSERFLFPEDLEIVANDLALARAGGGSNYGARIEHRFRRADGTTGFLSVSRILTRNEATGELRIRGAMQDISEMEQLRQQLLQSQKMEAIGQLAGGIAHDFNNYLTVILGYGQMLLQTLEPGDPRRTRVEAILGAAESSAALTAQLLAFSRREIAVSRRVDLNVLVEDVRSMLARLVGEDVRVTTSLADGACSVLIDPGQMQQVLVNLAVNARDAMPRGGRLEIGTRHEVLDAQRVTPLTSIPAGRYVVLSVRDSGVGIPEDVQRQMFEPFFTTKGPGRGTGLGLSVVYGVLHQSGCFIDVESRLGVGTTFFIYIPEAGAGSVIAADVAPAVAVPPPSGSETLLVVEDDPSIQELNREILESHGYRVLSAADGEAALELVRSFAGRIDLVITDVMLPRMSGAELVIELRRSTPGLRALFVSGYTDDAVLRLGIAREEVEFLQKPFSTATLVRKVREILDAP